MAKYFNPKKLISFLALLILCGWYFVAEIRLVTYKILDNFNEISVDTNADFIHFTDDFNLGNSFDLINVKSDELDLDKSYIQIYGSAAAYNVLPEVNFDIFDNGKVIDTISLKDIRVKIEGETINFRQSKKLRDTTSVLVTIHIVTKDGQVTDNGYIATLHKTNLNLFFGRYSYFAQYFIWYLALFGSAVQGITWSTVYNSSTKRPINRAIIRIIKDGVLWDTYVTGPTGSIPLKVPAGTYRMIASKSDYKFPSRLSPLTSDGEFRRLYYGKEFKVSRNNSKLKLNIPMDPTSEEKKSSLASNAFLAVSSITDSFNRPLLIFMSVIQIVSWPTYLESWVSAFLCVALLGVQNAFQAYTTKNPGVVVDQAGAAVGNIKVDVYDGQWNTFLTTATTDRQGNYEFIMPQGDYKVKIDSPEYQLSDDSAEIFIKGGSKSAFTRKNVYINSKITVKKKAL